MTTCHCLCVVGKDSEWLWHHRHDAMLSHAHAPRTQNWPQPSLPSSLWLMILFVSLIVCCWPVTGKSQIKSHKCLDKKILCQITNSNLKSQSQLTNLFRPDIKSNKITILKFGNSRSSSSWKKVAPNFAKMFALLRVMLISCRPFKNVVCLLFSGLPFLLISTSGTESMATLALSVFCESLSPSYYGFSQKN